MGDDSTRTTATQLLEQLADLIGVQSPRSSATTNVGSQRSSPAPRPLSNDNFAALNSNVSLSPSTIRAEMSHLFAPYPRPSTSTAGFRLAGRPAFRQRPTPSRHVREYTGRICCLGGPLDQTTPNDARMLTLKRNGLGDGVVTTDYLASAAKLREALEIVFPKLAGVDIGLYRALTGGKGKSVVRISNIEPIPSVPHLRASRVGLIYILPSSNFLTELLEREEQQISASGQAPETIDLEPAVRPTFETNSQPSVVPETEVIIGEPPTNSQLLETDLEVLTLEDYRNQVYDKNEGYQYILASRERFLEKILGIYKDPRLNLLKKPKIEFQGESGADIGAITREYFWKGLTGVVSEQLDGLPLFEGEMNHKFPSTDGRLLRSGVFKTVGKFMSHSALHCGIGFLGLSEAVAQYLVQEQVDSDTPLPITSHDVPELDVRNAIQLLGKLKSGATLAEDEMIHVQGVAESSEFGGTVTPVNAGFVIEQIFYHSVIDRRAKQLEALRAGFKSTGISDFVKGKPYLVPSLFPRSTEFDYPVSLIVGKIQCSGNPEKLDVITQFIQTLAEVPHGLQNLLCAWTGWPILPEDPLVVRFEDDVDFEVHTCFNEIVIPSGLSSDEIMQKLNLLLNYGSSGFGGV